MHLILEMSMHLRIWIMSKSLSSICRFTSFCVHCGPPGINCCPPEISLWVECAIMWA